MAARTPAECDTLFADYVNKGDLEALLGLYEPACSLVQRDRSVATGHAAIRVPYSSGRLAPSKPVSRSIGHVA